MVKHTQNNSSANFWVCLTVLFVFDAEGVKVVHKVFLKLIETYQDY